MLPVDNIIEIDIKADTKTIITVGYGETKEVTEITESDFDQYTKW